MGGLKVEDFLERRLQTQVFKLGLSKSIHHARVLICQRHIRVRKQIVNVPSFLVRLDSQKHIDFSNKSPFGGGRHGRVKRKNMTKIRRRRRRRRINSERVSLLCHFVPIRKIQAPSSRNIYDKMPKKNPSFHAYLS